MPFLSWIKSKCLKYIQIILKYITLSGEFFGEEYGIKLSSLLVHLVNFLNQKFDAPVYLVLELKSKRGFSQKHALYGLLCYKGIRVDSLNFKL